MSVWHRGCKPRRSDQKIRKTTTIAATPSIKDYYGSTEKDDDGYVVYHSEGQVRQVDNVLHWEYAIRDHLGNTRILYDDHNGDNSLDILQNNQYYAFGMSKYGEWSKQGMSGNDYKYNGKELNREFGLGVYDYGARFYDPVVGRFTTTDRFVEKYPNQSPYHYAANNPIKFIDVNGDSIWTTLNQTYNDAGKLVNNFTINVEGKVLNQMGWFGNGSKVASGINDFYNAFSSSSETDGAITNISFNVNFSEASSMAEVSESDHLMVMVDNVLGKADPSLGGGDAGGLAAQPGKIGYIEGSSASTAVHELGHMMGLGHSPNGTRNVMSYDSNLSNLTFSQMNDILGNVYDSNQGSNRTRARYTTSNRLYHTSTNVQPWEFNVKKGDVIPAFLVNKRR